MINIKTGDTPCSVFVSDVYEHSDLKYNILTDINKNAVFSVNDPGREIIYNTDFFINRQFNYFKYSEFVSSVFERHNKALSNLLEYEINIVMSEMWFQQYAPGNFHGWHRHNNCTFSNVYYVDLPATASKTTFKFLGREFDVDVKEGQILTFPSFLCHCSKPNKSSNIKTVIAFNSS
jgi:hypothetical protein